MSAHPLTENQQELIRYLETMKAMRQAMGDTNAFFYKGMEHFLLENAGWYEPQPWTDEYHRGAPKQCFGNAMILGVNAGLRYVEGVAMAEKVPFPVQHAWNVDARGMLVDNTWLNTGLLYFGVEFSLGRADDAIWNGDCSVLDDYRRGHPLYRQPWSGEDYARKWKASDGMKLAQRLIGEAK